MHNPLPGYQVCVEGLPSFLSLNFHLLPIGQTLQKHAYLNILKILPPKTWKFFDEKKNDIFHISAQNIDLGTR